MEKTIYNKKLLALCECDDIWFEIANDPDGRERILVFGDNVSSQYAYFLNRDVYKGKKYIDKCTTTKAVDNPALLMLIDYMLLQEKNCSHIHLHSGFFGRHMSDEEFKAAYCRVVRYIRGMHPEYTLTVAALPPVCESKSEILEGYNEIIRSRNKIILEIARQEAVPAIDLFPLIKGKDGLYKDDGILLTDEGGIILAEHCGRFFEEQQKL